MPSINIYDVKLYTNMNLKVFVETGTFEGETLNNMLNHFDSLYSIELSPYYASKAKERFSKEDKVTILEGDSSVMLKPLCEKLNEPVFFWLDGHWSGGLTSKGNKDCPLLEELKIINNVFKNECVIAIDDVRLFGTNIHENWLDITIEKIYSIIKDRVIYCDFFPSSLDINDIMVLHLSKSK